MANKEQVERLRRGVREWKSWREEHPEIRPDLSEADLSEAYLYEAHLEGAVLNWAHLEGANLTGANLTRADLYGTTLTGANLIRVNLTEAYLNRAHLKGANLTEANLTRADLTRADLYGTTLTGANLTGVYLNGANLTEANLIKANPTRADLYGVDLTGVHFGDTLFARVDLSDKKDLETAVHHTPSSIDINSVVLPTNEHTRTHFLRGIGFSETQIEYLLSLLTPRPIQYVSLFISHAGQDEPIARHLHADLRKNNVPCWLALHDLRPGNYYRDHIDQAIHSQDKLLLLLSEHSVKSGWVRHEVMLAQARENEQQREVLFPIRLDDAIFHSTANWAVSLRATRHIGDFTGWQNETTYGKAFAELLRHLKTGKPPVL